MIKVICFKAGKTSTFMANSLDEAIEKYYKKRRLGWGCGHYFIGEERVWLF